MMKDENWRMKDEKIDFKLFGGFGVWQTNERTDEQTFVIVELLSQLKIFQKLLKHYLQFVLRF